MSVGMKINDDWPGGDVISCGVTAGRGLSGLKQWARRVPVCQAPGDDGGPNAPDGPGGNEDGADTGLITKTRTKTKKPSLYKVLLLNDDYTPQEFVIFVLERFFNKGLEDATRIMLHVHHKGVGICGVYTFEIAETKVAEVMDFARQNQHPLQCTMEKE